MKHRHFGLVSDPDVLYHVGPHIKVILQPHPALTPRAQPTTGIAVRLLIDTGAQRTFLAQSRCHEIGVTPIRFDRIIGLDGEARDYPIYPIRFEFGVGPAPAPSAPGKITFDCETVGMPDPHPECGHEGLMGRDVLRHFELFYDGPRGLYFVQVPDALISRIDKGPSRSKDPDPKERTRAKNARRARRNNR